MCWKRKRTARRTTTVPKWYWFLTVRFYVTFKDTSFKMYYRLNSLTRDVGFQIPKHPMISDLDFHFHKYRTHSRYHAYTPNPRQSEQWMSTFINHITSIVHFDTTSSYILLIHSTTITKHNCNISSTSWPSNWSVNLAVPLMWRGMKVLCIEANNFVKCNVCSMYVPHSLSYFAILNVLFP